MKKEMLLSAIHSRKRERKYVEEMELGSIIAPAIKMHGWNVYVWGYRCDTMALVNYLEYLDIFPLAIFDRDCSKIGTEIYGIKVKSVDEMFSIDAENAFLIINISYLQGVKEIEAKRILDKAGIKRYYVVMDCERLNIQAYSYEWSDGGRDEYYKDHEKELLYTFSILADDTSQDAMIEYIRRYTEYGIYHGMNCDGRLKYFWGQYPDGSIEDIYLHKKDEVWLNCGANIGDSIMWYFANGLLAKKILAYESDKSTYNRMMFNLNFLNDSDRKSIWALNEKIDSNSNIEKHLEADEQISLINADIEGNESELLKAVSGIINNNRPVLAISAYHKPSDLVELPSLILGMADNYIFKLRKYESSARDISRSSELVLYAIPNERC